MKRVLIAVIVVLIALVGVALIAPSFIPAETYREPIRKAVQDATGRDLTLGGELSLSLLPTPRVTARDVALANAPGATSPQMASMRELRVAVGLLPLLSGRVEVDEFVLVEPEINLEVLPDGKPNWVFETAAPSRAPDAPAPSAGGGGTPREISLGDIRIEDGAARYLNRQSGADYALSDIDLTVSMPSLSGPFAAEGGLVYEGERVELTADLGNPRAFLDGAETDVALAVRSVLAAASFDGSAKASAPNSALPFAGTGKASVDVKSVRELMAWLAEPLQGAEEGFGPFKVDGEVSVDGNRLDFADAALAFDETTGTGHLTIALDGQRPKLTGALAIDSLDATPYAGGGGSGGGAGGSSGGAGGTEGWSEAPMDFGALKAIDADIDLSADALRYGDIKIGQSDLKLRLVNGRLEADLSKLALYEGLGTATLLLDASGPMPTLRSRFDIGNIVARPLLTDAIGFDRLEGLGKTLTVEFTTRGRSQREMIAALNGTGSLAFLDGAIYGLNIAQLVRSVKTAITEMRFDQSQQKTDFAELAGSFVIRDGILQNDDMRLLNPLLRVEGQGVVDLVKREIRYRINPVAVSTLEGQGGKTDVTGLSVPILITGSFEEVKIQPDVADVGRRLLEGALSGNQPTAEGEEAPSVGDRLLQGLIGGGKGPPAPEAAPSGATPPAESGTAAPQAPATA
ncbi:MAG: AsmA family protein, partial [Alphaproteobacteria bacterium]|nr:AsmA family protein [Alphaproteobacteria bacterium]